MFLERRDEVKLHKGSVLVGYDLEEGFAQISYRIYGQDEIETVATVAGTKQYNIPVVLCKRKGVNQWYYGKDAVKNASSEDVLLVEDLVTLAKVGKMVELDGETYDPVALLTLFIKRSLMLLNFIAPVENIAAIMFTVDELDDRMVDVLAKAAVNLGLKTSKIYFQSHTESFYSFVLHQPVSLWAYQVLACEHDGRRLKTYRLECNKRTTPIVVLIEEGVYETLVLPAREEEEALKQDAYALLDERFLEILTKQCEGRIVSSVYLLGDGFKSGWDEKSLQFLCRNRRVFQGNNLFSTGACHSVYDKLEPDEQVGKYVFLGRDKLKANIGMEVLKRGEKSYFALLDAGINWYEAKKECQFLLGSEKSIPLVITPLNGKNVKTIEIPLDEMQDGGAPFTRYTMEMSMVSPQRIHMKITNMGFGELFPANGQVLEKEIEVP